MSRRNPLIQCLSFCVVAFVLSGSVRAADLAVEVPKPIELGSKEVSLFIAIPNPDSFFKTLETAAAMFSPIPMKPGMLKAQVGIGIGDPDLASLDGSKPIVVMVLKAPPQLPPMPPRAPSFAVFIPVKKPDAFKNALEAIAKLKVEVKDNVVIASDKPEALELAVAQKAVYDKIATADIKAGLRIYASIEMLVESYGAQMDAGLDGLSKTFAQMPMNPGGPAAAAGMDPKMLSQIMKVYIKAISGMVKQSQAVQFDLSLKDDGLQQDILFVAKPDSAVAKLLAEPASTENKLLPLLRPGALMGIAYRVNPAAMSAFADAVIPEIEKDPELKSLIDDKMIALVKDAVQLGGGEMVVEMLPVEKGFAVTRTAMTLTDEKKYVELLDRSVALLAPDTFLGKLYANMGMSIVLEKNVREHAGVSLQRMKFKFDPEKMNQPQAAQMKLMMRDTEVATVKGAYVSASDPAEMDGMIDQIQAGLLPKDGEVPLKAMKTFGPKRHVYVEYDLLGLMKATLGADQNNPMAGAFKDIKAGNPIQAAGVISSGRLYMQVLTPLTPLAEMGKTMRQMGGQGVRPPPPPPDNPGGQF